MIKFACIALILQHISFVTSTNRPIIGILAQQFWSGIFKPNNTFIAASYVKAVEAAGARVGPIFTNQKREYYKNLLKSINGVVIPGGGANLESGCGYYDALTMIYEISKEMNDKGTYFPIFGVCRGFEALLKIANNHTDIQTRCRVMRENNPLEFTPNYRKSLLYSELPKNINIYLKYFDVTHNYHRWCTTPQNFSQSSLSQEWTITSENISKRGLRYISSVEHKTYPFVAVQFHPEKYFEWSPTQNNPHSKIAILANRYFYDFIVEQAKLNYNKFTSERKESKFLIYNYAPIHSRATRKMGYDQIYLFE